MEDLVFEDRRQNKYNRSDMINFDNLDKKELAKMALNVIDEKIEEIDHKQSICRLVDEATLC